MGEFWNAAVFKKQNTVNVQEVLKKLAEGDNRFELIPEECKFHDCEGGTAIEFNDHCIAFDEMAAALSQSLEGPVLVCDIYDGDYWDYWLYKSGKELSRFMTIPDYFEELDDQEKEQWCGNAELLSAEFGCPAEPLADYLCFWDETMPDKDTWEVLDFLRDLGFALEED